MNQSNILSYFVVFLLGLLGLRLFQLQILEHDKFQTLAKNNSSRTAITLAPRGVIYDRNDEVLATSKQSLSIVVYANKLKTQVEKDSVIEALVKLVDLPKEQIEEIINKIDPSTPLPIAVDNNISIETAIKIFENSKELPAIGVQEQAIRFFPHNEIGAHLLGYVGQISENELKEGRSRGLTMGDIVGKDGVEKVCDETLQGIKGEARVAVDRFGKSLNKSDRDQLVIRKAIKGGDLHLTIDQKLQEIAQRELGERMGAVIAMNPKNGEIYCMVSSPSYDPNIFTKPVPYDTFNELMKRKAFINRSIHAFTPGSIWKPFTALAGLEHGVVKEDEKLAVSGAIYFGGFKFGDWTNATGSMDLTEAIAWSRDTYFYQIAKRMRPEWIAELARKFGGDEKTGVEVLGEYKGIIPDPAWKEKTWGEPWYPGNTLHYAIGQSFLLVTPIQVAKMFSGFANEGYTAQPHVVKDPDKEYLTKIENVSLTNIRKVKKGLEACVDHGTGGASRFEEIKVAGKTGSAEVHGYAHTTHGWFAAYAPVEDPQIVVVVFVEGGGHGGSVAAPIARKIFEEFFELNKASQITQAPEPIKPSQGEALTAQ
jgi:penicillin-binding protein 2